MYTQERIKGILTYLIMKKKQRIKKEIIGIRGRFQNDAKHISILQLKTYYNALFFKILHLDYLFIYKEMFPQMKTCKVMQ